MHQKFADAGATLIAVSPQVVEKNRALKDQLKLKFEILHDPHNEIAAAFGLRWTMPDDLQALYLQFGLDLPASNGDTSWTLPLPARYVIDKQGTIRYAQINPDYTRRPEPEQTLEALTSLGS